MPHLCRCLRSLFPSSFYNELPSHAVSVFSNSELLKTPCGTVSPLGFPLGLITNSEPRVFSELLTSGSLLTQVKNTDSQAPLHVYYNRVSEGRAWASAV